jgi:hypothetical protein
LTGFTCSSDNDCNGGTAATTGTCQFLTKKETMYGWDGYCLERDTSINLYGTTNEQACLTWLPVDQLSGSTDLYGKHFEAGYEPQNTYYCAELTDAYSVAVGNNDDGDDPGPACAETNKAFGCKDGDGWEGFLDYVKNKGSCLASVWCPDGYFALVSGCGRLGYIDGTETDDAGTLYCSVAHDGGADEDCPFFCVPKNSYKTTVSPQLTDKIDEEIGDPCLPPGRYSVGSVDLSEGAPVLREEFTAAEMAGFYSSDRNYPTGIIPADYDSSVNGLGYPAFDAYVVSDRYMGVREDVSDPGVTYLDLMEYYDDCRVRGVTGDTINDYIYPFTTVADLLSTRADQPESELAYRNLHFNINSYTACEALVQVSSDSPIDGNYNYAWTDRTWSGQDTPVFAIRDEDGRFEYVLSTEQDIYGQSTDRESYLDSFAQEDASPDVYPLSAVMCETGSSTTGQSQTVGGVLACTTGDKTSESGLQAQPYYDVTLAASIGYTGLAGTANEGFCDDNNGDTSSGTSDLSRSVSEGECQCDPAPRSGYYDDCNSGISCSGGTCVGGGPRDGQECESDYGCYEFICVADGQTLQGDGVRTEIDVCAQIDESASGTTIQFVESETYANAMYRLRQIFAKVMNVWYYQDPLNDENYSPTNSTDDLVDDDLGDWTLASSPYGLGTYLDYSEEGSADFSMWYNNQNYTSEGDPSSVSLPKEPSAPVVLSVGSCTGTQCEEGLEGTFGVNGVDNGIVYGSSGYVHATVSFFAYADQDQMPIRNIIVGWGDGEKCQIGDTGCLPYSTDSFSGSTDDGNFYKNHRGYNPEGSSECDTSSDGFGGNPSACENTYITFTNDYVCSDNDLLTLTNAGRICDVDPDSGRLLVSPCTGSASGFIEGGDGACVFQPRVHVRDNWGWCTGECDSGRDGDGESLGGDECYQGSGRNGNECNITHCPSETFDRECPDYSAGTIDNPWVNFDGYIVVTP